MDKPVRVLRSTLAAQVDYGSFLGLIEKHPTLTPSDIDGIIERRGKFFVMEWKRPNEKVSVGQQIMLQALAKESNFTVLIVRGDTDNGMKVSKFYKVHPYKSCELMGESKDKFIQYYLDWFKWADDQR